MVFQQALMLIAKRVVIDCLSINDLISLYNSFYLEVFGIKTEFFKKTTVQLSNSNEIFWPICVSFKLGLRDILTYLEPKVKNLVISGKFKLSLHGKSSKDYVVYTSASFDAIEELKDLSLEQLVRGNIEILNLKEMLILNIFIFWLTGFWLDENFITLTKSVDESGHAIIIHAEDDNLVIGSRWPWFSLFVLRARRAFVL